MADYPGKKAHEARLRAADKAMPTPGRPETDKYILDRFAQNLPGQRPDADPGSYIPEEDYDSPGYRYARRMPSEPQGFFGGRMYGDRNRRELLAGWDQYKKDLETISSGGQAAGRRPTGYHVGAYGEAEKRLSEQDPDYWYETRRNLQRRNTPNPTSFLASKRLNPTDPLTDKERQQLKQFESEMVKDLAAPGAEKDRLGRLQEFIEAANLLNPNSAGRAALRELGRGLWARHRVRIGRKTQSGEEVLKDKMKEMELAGTIPEGHLPRYAAMQELGWSSVPESVPVLDSSGNQAPLYLDEMKKAREEAAEKAYQEHRGDPVKGPGPPTPERD